MNFKKFKKMFKFHHNCQRKIVVEVYRHAKFNYFELTVLLQDDLATFWPKPAKVLPSLSKTRNILVTLGRKILAGLRDEEHQIQPL